MDLKLGGILPASGYAGLTLEGPQDPVQGNRSILTARSTFKFVRTRFFASEIIIESGDVVTEQSVITGTDGRGLFKNADGYFHILGNSIGQPAKVRGEICNP